MPSDAWIGIAAGVQFTKTMEGFINSGLVKNRSLGVGEIVYVNFSEDMSWPWIELPPGSAIVINAEDTSTLEGSLKIRTRFIHFLIAATSPGPVDLDLLYTIKSYVRQAEPDRHPVQV